MVEQRQLAERRRQLGNDAFKSGQYSEALRCYELGLEAQRHNMALHANAAMAALKLNCYVAAQEHCDKVRSSCCRCASTKSARQQSARQQSARSSQTTCRHMLLCCLLAGPAPCGGPAQHTQASSLCQGAAEARSSIPGAVHAPHAAFDWRSCPIAQLAPRMVGCLALHCRAWGSTARLWRTCRQLLTSCLEMQR